MKQPQQVKHELSEVWRNHVQSIQQEIQRQDQEILVLKGMIANKQEEQNVLRKHASFLIGQLVVEAQLPTPLEGAYRLSEDGRYLVATVESKKE